MEKIGLFMNNKAIISIKTDFEEFFLVGTIDTIEDIIKGFKALKQALDNNEVSYGQFEDTVYRIKEKYDVEVITKGYSIEL
jgi:hypothetical protein